MDYAIFDQMFVILTPYFVYFSKNILNKMVFILHNIHNKNMLSIKLGCTQHNKHVTKLDRLIYL